MDEFFWWARKGMHREPANAKIQGPEGTGYEKHQWKVWTVSVGDRENSKA